MKINATSGVQNYINPQRENTTPKPSKNNRSEKLNIGDIVLIKNKVVDTISGIVFRDDEIMYKMKVNNKKLYKASDLRKLKPHKEE